MTDEIDYEQLSDREWEVCRLVARGLQGKEIAAKMGTATETEKSHVKHILEKLGLNNRVQIAVWYTEERLAGRLPKSLTEAA